MLHKRCQTIAGKYCGEVQVHSTNAGTKSNQIKPNQVNAERTHLGKASYHGNHGNPNSESDNDTDKTGRIGRHR